MTFPFVNMSLGIMSSKECWRDPDGIKTTGGFGRQVEEFARYFSKTVLLVPFEEKNDLSPGYQINIAHLTIIPLPQFDGTGLLGKLDFLTKLPTIFFRIWRSYLLCDVWQFRMPGYIGLLGVIVHKLRRSRRSFIWLGTDWSERIRESGDTWLRRRLARLAKYLIDWARIEIPTFALGNLASKHAQPRQYMHSTVSTIISARNLKREPKIHLSLPPRLLFVGRLSLEKGLPDLLEALFLARLVELELDLTIVGDGPEYETLAALVQQYHIKEQVHFVGYVPAGDMLWEYYSQADIFILPSLSEAQGKVLIEAMATGLPVIATRVGGIPSIIQHEKTGLLVEPHSPQSILDATRNILSDPDLRANLSAAALSTACAYTIESQTKKIMLQLENDFSALGWRLKK